MTAEDRVTVLGTARREVEPTSVIWRAEVVEAGDDEVSAYVRCVARLKVLGEQLAAVGDVSTDTVAVQPRWDQGVQRGVEALGAVRVRAPVAQAGEAAQAAMAAEADRLHGPQFVLDAPEAVQEELLVEALAAARRKAERLAEAAGRGLGRVISIEEQGPHRAGGDVRAMAVEAPDIRPGDQTVRTAVTATFALVE